MIIHLLRKEVIVLVLFLILPMVIVIFHPIHCPLPVVFLEIMTMDIVQEIIDRFHHLVEALIVIIVVVTQETLVEILVITVILVTLVEETHVAT